MNVRSVSGKRIVLGFAGPKNCGKDTGAIHLAQKFGYTVLGFADPIREELIIAYNLRDVELLVDHRKELLTDVFAFNNCRDARFVKHLKSIGWHDPLAPMSPRQAQQYWGDYKRSFDVDYFIKIMAQRITDTDGPVAVSGVRVSYTHPDPHAERKLIDSFGGHMVHIESDSDIDDGHGTEQKLPRLQHDFVIRNTKLSPDGRALYLRAIEGLHEAVVNL